VTDPTDALGRAIGNWESSIAYMQQQQANAQALVSANPSFVKSPLDYRAAIQNAQLWLDKARQAQASGSTRAIQYSLETARNAWRSVDLAVTALNKAGTDVIPRLGQQVARGTQIVPQLAQEAAPAAESLAADAPLIPEVIANVEQDAPLIVGGGTAVTATAAATGVSLGTLLAGGALVVLLVGGGYLLWRHYHSSSSSSTVALVTPTPAPDQTLRTLVPSQLPLVVPTPSSTSSTSTSPGAVTPPLQQGPPGPGQGTGPTGNPPPASSPTAPQIGDITSDGGVSASSTFNSSYAPQLAVDRDPTTSWFSNGDGGNPSTFRWTAPSDHLITQITIVGNAQNSNPAFQSGYGFQSTTVQVVDAGGNVVYTHTFPGPGAASNTVVATPNVTGRSIVLSLAGHETPTCGGFSELTVNGSLP
jgi:hypothetical protein